MPAQVLRNRKGEREVNANDITTEKEETPLFSDEQKEAVNRIRKCRDFYEILGVSKDVDEAVLRKHYKKMALQIHPDKNKAPGAVEAFKAIGNAFAVLSDPEKRKRYDMYRPEAASDSSVPQANAGHFYTFEDVRPMSSYEYKEKMTWDCEILLFSAALEDLWKAVKRNLTDPDPHPIGCPSLYHNCYARDIRRNFTLFEWQYFWHFFFSVKRIIMKDEYRNIDLMADMLVLACEMSIVTVCDHHERSYNLMLWILMSSSGKRGLSAGKFFPLELLPKEDEMPVRLLMHLPYAVAHHYINSRFDVIRQAAISGNIGLLELLLEFGVTVLRPEDNWLERNNAERLLGKFFPILRYTPGFIEERFQRNIDVASRQRVLLVIRALQVFSNIRQQSKHTKKHVDSLNLLFESIPDPEVSVNEIKSILEKLCLGPVSMEDIKSLSEQFGYCFPNSRKPFQPRCLQHLARCQVRESLRSPDSYLPKKVDALHLPISIKNYILLKSFEKNPIMLTNAASENYIISRHDFVYYVPHE